MFASTILSAVTLAGVAFAADHQVKVGDGGNVYNPNSITAAVGDTVSFHFTGSRHDVIQANYDSPCMPLSGGFSVGIQSSSDAVYTINVTDTNPLFFYCSVGVHCQSGMVGAINPSSSETLDTFKSKAASASSGNTPDGVNGGVLVQGTSTVGGSAKTSATGSSSSAASSAGGAVATGSSSTSTGGAALATAAPAAFALLAGVVAGVL